MGTTGNDPKLKLVLAEHHPMFRAWCRDNHINPNDSRLVKYIMRAQDMRGYDVDRVIIIAVGRWWMGKTSEQVQDIRDAMRMYEALGTQHIRHIPRRPS